MSVLVLLPVILLMISVGMSLRLNEVFSIWRSLGASRWLRIWLATYIIPPVFAVALAEIMELSLGDTAGLVMVAVAPGAPLLTRNMVKRGFDLHRAASYQLWAALMVPLMIPLLMAVIGRFFDRHIWVPPMSLLSNIATRQLLPLAAGMALSWFFPKLSHRLQPTINTLGNLMLTVVIVLAVLKLGSVAANVTLLVPIAALSLAVVSIAAISICEFKEVVVKQTFALCNANRHVGLALLLAGNLLHLQKAVPMIACYALITPIVMTVYVKLFSSPGRTAASTA